MRIEYVEVSAGAARQRLGKQLVEKAVAFATRGESSSVSDLIVRTSCDPS
jgi:hypothetical protein